MVLSGKDDNGRNGSQLSSSLVGSVTKAHAVVRSATPPRVFIVSGKPCAPSLPHSPSHLFQDIFGFQCGPCAQCSLDCGKVTEMGPCSVQQHLAPPQHLPVTDHITKTPSDSGARDVSRPPNKAMHNQTYINLITKGNRSMTPVTIKAP